VLLECGMRQGGRREEEEVNARPFPFDPGSLDAVVISHAHIDHSGLLPRLAAVGLLLDSERHELLVDGHPVDLSATEFAILALLMRSPGRVYSRSGIIDAIKGPDYPVTDRSIDVQIVALRRKLGVRGACVDTVRAVGYRFLELAP